MKTKLFHYLAASSIVLLLLSEIMGVGLPYGNYAELLMTVIVAFWFWIERRNIQSLRLENYGKYQNVAELLFVGCFGYLLARQALFSSGWVFNYPLLASIFRLVELPQMGLLLSGIFIVIFSKPQKTIIEIVDKRIGRRTVFALLLLFMTIGFGLRAYNLGSSDIRGDEFQVIGAAAGYMNTGEYYRWDWIKDKPSCLDTTDGSCVYKRAWPHTWMIAQTYKLLGISETTSRIPSVIFGTLFIAASYLVGKYLTKSRTMGLWVAGFVTVATSYISLSRYTRMYVVLLPIFALLVYALMRALHEKLDRNLLGKIQEALPYQLVFVGLAGVLLYFNYHIHVNSLVLLPALLIYVCLLALVRRNYRYSLPAVLGALAALGGVWYVISGNFKFSGMISWFGRNNQIYWSYIYDFPLGYEILLIVAILAFASMLLYLKGKVRNLPVDRLLFLPVLLGIGTYFFIYFADRYASFVYTSHLTFFALVFSLVLIWLLIRHFSRISQILLMVIVVAAGLFPLVSVQADKYHAQGEAKHSVAYEVIKENYDPQTDILFTQYGRAYYLKGIDTPNMVSMSNNQKYELESFLESATKSSRIWASWESGKRYHLRPEIVAFIDQRFEKLHGSGIDDTKVEVYFCDDSSVCLENAQEFIYSGEVETATPEAELLSEPEEESID